MKFVFMGRGDWSVGIPDSFGEIDFQVEGLVWDADEIARVKQMIAEWDDNGTEVFTQDEYEKLESGLP